MMSRQEDNLLLDLLIFCAGMLAILAVDLGSTPKQTKAEIAHMIEEFQKRRKELQQ